MGAGEGGAGGPAAGVKPGALSALLQEIAAAPQETQGGAWEAALRPGATIGKFELIRELGRGGFGTVWEARDKELGRNVAFKAVRAGGRAGLREERLLLEAEAAARLSHPNLVTLHDLGRAAPGAFLVLELLQGRTLEDRLSQGRLSLREAVRIASEVAKGVAHAHAKGVVHRDLKPGNIFLCDDRQVKVLDFGLAHAFGQQRLDGGTPAYMAPEQWEGAPEDERTDVFALGVLLFRMLAGELPFADPDGNDHISSRPAPALPVPALPALGELVGAMLSKRPVEQPRDGNVVVEALRDIQGHLDRRESRSEPAVHTRRRWLPALFLALAVALAAAGAVLGLTWWRRASLAAASSSVAEAIPSVAVLPFADLSPGGDQEYFADGVAEEILNALARVPGLKVVGRTSSFYFRDKAADPRDIGAKLGVAHLLEGSVRREGGRVRVTAQLIQASDGRHVWADAYDRALPAAFGLQEDVARGIAGALRLTLLREARGGGTGWSASVEARNRYLIGVHFRRQGSLEGFRRAEAALRRAIAIDPGFARAHAVLSYALMGRYGSADAASAPEVEQLLGAALAAAERSVELAPELAEAYQARGAMRRRVLWDWAGARSDLEQALALAPGDPDALWNLGLHLAMLGRMGEGLDHLRSATALDPLSAEAWRHLGFVLMASGNLVAGEEALQRGVEVAPDHDWARGLLAMSQLVQGRPADALSTLEQSRAPEVWKLWGRCFALHSLGRHPEAQAALDEYVTKWSHVGAYQVAEMMAWRGEADRAFEWLERAFRERDGGMLLASLDPLLASLHADPRWSTLLRKMDLPGR